MEQFNIQKSYDKVITQLVSQVLAKRQATQADAGLADAKVLSDYFSKAIACNCPLEDHDLTKLAVQTTAEIRALGKDLSPPLSQRTRDSVHKATKNRHQSWPELFGDKTEIYLPLGAIGNSVASKLDAFIAAHNANADRLYAEMIAANDPQAGYTLEQQRLRLHPTRPANFQIYNRRKDAWDQEPKIGATLFKLGAWELYDEFQYVNSFTRATKTEARHDKPGHVINYMHRRFVNGDEIEPRDLAVVISRDPMKIAAMSTGTRWSSCMSEGGINFHYVPPEIQAGTVVAYLVCRDDPDAHYPLMRVLLKPYVNKDGESILFPNKIYGAINNAAFGGVAGATSQAFMDTLVDYLTVTVNRDKKGKYTMLPELYRDGLSGVVELAGDSDSIVSTLKERHSRLRTDAELRVADLTGRAARAAVYEEKQAAAYIVENQVFHERFGKAINLIRQNHTMFTYGHVFDIFILDVLARNSMRKVESLKASKSRAIETIDAVRDQTQDSEVISQLNYLQGWINRVSEVTLDYYRQKHDAKGKSPQFSYADEVGLVELREAFASREYTAHPQNPVERCGILPSNSRDYFTKLIQQAEGEFNAFLGRDVPADIRKTSKLSWLQNINFMGCQFETNVFRTLSGFFNTINLHTMSIHCHFKADYLAADNSKSAIKFFKQGDLVRKIQQSISGLDEKDAAKLATYLRGDSLFIDGAIGGIPDHIKKAVKLDHYLPHNREFLYLVGAVFLPQESQRLSANLTALNSNRTAASDMGRIDELKKDKRVYEALLEKLKDSDQFTYIVYQELKQVGLHKIVDVAKMRLASAAIVPEAYGLKPKQKRLSRGRGIIEAEAAEMQKTPLLLGPPTARVRPVHRSFGTPSSGCRQMSRMVRARRAPSAG